MTVSMMVVAELRERVALLEEALAWSRCRIGLLELQCGDGKIRTADVVQIDPSAHPRFAATFGIVEEVYGWGILANVPTPQAGVSGIAPIRLATDQYARIGVAEWFPQWLDKVER